MYNMIAEAKRVEHTIRNLTVMAEQATEGIIIVDLDGNIRFVNTAWASMHNYANRAELLGKSISMFHTEEQMRSDVLGLLEETKHRGQIEGTIWHMQSSGTTFATRTKMTALNDENGNVVGFIVFATDTGEIRQVEELLMQRNTELYAAKEQLQSQITNCQRLRFELQQCRNQLEQRRIELTIARENFQKQNAEREHVENELRQYGNDVERQITELATALNKVVRFAESGTELLYDKV